jgi:hypothetical protein
MKLADWLTEKDVKRNEFARRLRVSPQLITGYCDGSIWPGKERMRQIMRETDGAVTADDFVSDVEQVAAE